ncbi:MAG: LysM peptidoglycan-binding domain-containing protein [Actinomycetota bacterium]|nr:LysM peptidoglycan-binding domain-containing protein [Actinomycetota bacterium]
MLRKPLAVLGFSAAAAIGSSLASAGVASASPALPAAVSASSAVHQSTYTVRPGDSLWAIGQRYGINENALAAANSMQLSDVLYAGRTLTLPTSGSTSPAPASTTSSTSNASSFASARTSSTRTSSARTSSAHSSSASGASSGTGSLGQCVISRESGGQSQVTNGSGHWGLYQFSKSTWEAYGGSSGSFGNGSSAQQNQVFNNAIAHGGASNWTPYDGC